MLGRTSGEPLEPGKLIVLNGTSSAGKTSLGKAIQTTSPEPWILTGIDHWWSRLPDRYLDDEAAHPDGFQSIYQGSGQARRTVGFRIGPTFRRLMYGLHRSVRGLVETGNNVIVDYLPFDEDLRRDAVTSWSDLGCHLIGVKPPIEVSEQWERERGDRDLGQARAMYTAAQALGRYDLVIDPSLGTPEDAARVVLDHVASATPSALKEVLDGL